ncbi:MAG: MgtC/SapB family protein [Anaerotignaceae bacterium]
MNLIMYLRDLNMASLVLRFVLAIVCGGIIGIERGRTKHAAGLRTHLLVCIGAASVMIVNQYISTYLTPNGDMARMGAQVISGIGFLGAGSIIITGQNRVKGLTTAAGLWVSATMGLAIGIGYYECAIVMCISIYCVLKTLSVVDDKFIKTNKILNLYIEFDDSFHLSNVIKIMRRESWHIIKIENISKSSFSGSIQITLLNEERNFIEEALLDEVRKVKGILFLEEI